jgi:hypothetical protein
VPPDDASQVVEAAGFEVGADGSLAARDGVWRTTDGAIRFLRARREPDGAWWLEGVEGRWGALTASAEGLRVGDSVEARDVRWVPCICDDGAPTWWGLRADTARRGPGGAWALQRPRLTVATPWRVAPLEIPLPDTTASPGGAWRPDLPRLGRDAVGWRAEAGARRVRGGSAGTVGAWWRESRGAGLSVGLTGADSHWFRAEGGSPLRNASPAPRGIAQGGMGAAGSGWTATAELDAVSDAAWASDMGEGWSARTVPWRESRALLRLGPARVGVSSAGGVDARVMPAATWSWTGGTARAAAFTALTSTDAEGLGVRSGARLTSDLAPRWLDVHADAAVAVLPGDVSTHAGVLEVAVPGWFATHGAPLRWALGGRVTRMGVDGGPADPPGWRAGPTVRFERAGPGWQVRGRAALDRDGAAGRWRPEARASVRGPALHLGGRVDAVGAEGLVEVTAGPWRLHIAAGEGGALVLPADEVLQEAWGAWSGETRPVQGWVAGGVGGGVGRVSVRLGVRAAGHAASPEADVAWDDGCTRLGVRAWWDPSAASPGFAVQLVPWARAPR